MARRAAKRSPILIWETKGNPWVDFLMVIMASGIAPGRVRTTTRTVESRKMAAILQIIGWQRHATLVYCVLLWYWTSMLWSTDTCQTKVSAASITWPYRGLNFTAHRRQVFFEVDRWPSAGFSTDSWAHVWLTCWKQGRIVQKPVNANPALNINQIITFSSFQMFLLLCFVYMVITETENRRPNNIYRLQNQNSTFSWVSLIGHWTTRPRSDTFRLA